jgi:hypothetical protein
MRDLNCLTTDQVLHSLHCGHDLNAELACRVHALNFVQYTQRSAISPNAGAKQSLASPSAGITLPNVQCVISLVHVSSLLCKCIITWFYQTVNLLPGNWTNYFSLPNVEDAPVAEHPGSASALLDVVIAIEPERSPNAELLKFPCTHISSLDESNNKQTHRDRNPNDCSTLYQIVKHLFHSLLLVAIYVL